MANVKEEPPNWKDFLMWLVILNQSIAQCIEIRHAMYRLAANDWRVGAPCTRSNPLSMILAPAMRER